MVEYHEPLEALTPESRELHRATKSLMEELEAVDWYHQRVVATQDDGLRAILEHHRDEEVEHACMLIEWLRRKVPKWDEALRTYLYTSGPITVVEAMRKRKEDNVGDLAIRSLAPSREAGVPSNGGVPK